jgi:hypothetical protein
MKKIRFTGSNQATTDEFAGDGKLIWDIWDEPIVVELEKQFPNDPAKYTLVKGSYLVKFMDELKIESELEAEYDLLGFANYCLELDIIVPTRDDVRRYYEQGGWEYYEGHIE